jgi:hypothetical protein
MEEIFETLREQIKGDFDQNNIIIILDNSISLTCKKHPIPGTNNSIIELNEHITRYEIITRQPLTKEYIRFFNEPKNNMN